MTIRAKFVLRPCDQYATIYQGEKIVGTISVGRIYSKEPAFSVSNTQGEVLFTAETRGELSKRVHAKFDVR